MPEPHAASDPVSASAPPSDPALDNPAWASLTGPHIHLASGNDLVRHYPRDVTAFVGVRSWEDPAVWDTLREMFGAGAEVVISHADPQAPEGWTWGFRMPGVQMVETPALVPRPDEEAVELGERDVEDMMDLVALTRPGPFLPRTHELGRYVGIRRGGRLVAMAGERMHPAAWTEISAVATHPDHQRQGLASRLVLDVAFRIRERGERALLHASAANTGAITAYERLGFRVRRPVLFAALRTP